MNDNMNDDIWEKEEPGLLQTSLTAALGVGIAVLLLSLIPALQMSCCLLVPGAGVLAAHMLKGKNRQMSVGVGAQAGCLTGIVMSTFMMAVNIAIMVYMGFEQFWKTQEENTIKQYQEAQLDPEMRQKMIDAAVLLFDWIRDNNGLTLTLMSLTFLLVVGAATTLGGVIGGAIWQSGDLEGFEYTADEEQS